MVAVCFEFEEVTKGHMTTAACRGPNFPKPTKVLKGVLGDFAVQVRKERWNVTVVAAVWACRKTDNGLHVTVIIEKRRSCGGYSVRIEPRGKLPRVRKPAQWAWVNVPVAHDDRVQN